MKNLNKNLSSIAFRSLLKVRSKTTFNTFCKSTAIIVLLITSTIRVEAATRTSTTTGGDWNTRGTWVGNTIPTSADNVIIATTGVNKVTVSNTPTIVNLTINTGGTLDINNEQDLTVTGYLTNNGTITGTTGRIALTGDFTNSGSFIVTTGRLTVTTGNFLNNTSGSFTIGSGRLSLGGSFTNSGTLSLAAEVRMTGTANQNIGGFTTTGTVSMTKTAGTATFNGNVNATGLTIDGTGSTLNLGTGLTHTFSGTWTRNAGTLDGGSSTLIFTKTGTINSGTGGTFTASNGTVKYSFGGIQTVVPLTYNNLTLAGSGVKTTTGITVNGILSMEGSATASALPTYGSNATLQYKGSAAQTTGIEFPATWSGTGGIKIENANGVTLGSTKDIGTNPLTIGSAITGSVFNDGGYQLTATGTLNLTSGTFKLGAATATTFPAFGTRNIADETTIEYAATATQTIKGMIYSNLTISGTGTNSKVTDGNITVNGILSLNSSNATAIQGCLDMSTYTLTMGATAATIGAGDVTGIIKRTSFVVNTPYDFGNQYTTINMAAGGTLPTEIQVKVSLGANPWKANAINRNYDIIQTGGSASTKASLALHYLDSELNGVIEGNIDLFDNHVTLPRIDDHGHSSSNSTNNWISIDNFSLTYIGSSNFNEKYWTLGTTTTVDIVWQGSTNSDWNDGSNWTGGVVPASGQIASIPDAATTANDPTLPASTTVGFVHIHSGGILNGGTGTSLTIDGGSGAWDNAGTFNAGTSTVTFTNASATMADPTNFYNVTVANGSTLTLGLDNIMRISGVLTVNGTGVLNAATNNNTVEYNGNGNQTIILPNGSTAGYHNLILSGSGTKTLPASAMTIYGSFELAGTATAVANQAITVNGNVTFGNGTSYDGGSGAYVHQIYGDWINNGATFQSSNSSISFNNTTTTQTIRGSVSSQTFSNISMTKSGQTLAIGGGTTSLTLTGGLTINSGTFDVGTATALSIGDNLSNSGTLITRTGTITFNGSGVQTISGANTFNNLTIQKSTSGAGVSATANQTVNGTLYLNSPNHSATAGALDMGANTLSMLSATATVTGNGDVTGIIKRTHTFTPNVEYSFGNPNTNISFLNLGTRPSEISCKVSIGTEPSYKAGGVKRKYNWAQTGTTGTDQVIVKMHYLDSELNGNTESKLVLYDYHNGATLHEHGKTSTDSTNNWVGISGFTIGYLATVTGLTTKDYILGDYATEKNTWNGVGTSWFNAASWSKGNIPVSTDNVLIPAGKSNYPTLNANAEAGTIEIASGAVLNAGAFDISIYGKGTVWSNSGTFDPGTGTVNFVHGIVTDILTTTGTTQFNNIYISDNTYLRPTTGSVIKLYGNAVGELSSIVDLSQFGTVVEYNGSNPQYIINPSTPGFSFTGYHDLILSGSGAKTLYGDELVISGDFTNNATLDLGITSTVSFIGTDVQTISGSVAPTFNNIIINNSTGISCSTDITVNGELNLLSDNPASNNKGTLDMVSTKTLTLGENSTVSGIGDVTGLVKRSHAFALSHYYAFNTANTGVTFADKSGQTLPTSITLRTTIGTSPDWTGTEKAPGAATAFPNNPIKRLYEIAQNGGAATNGLFRVHYKDNEIPATVEEATLTLWSRVFNGTKFLGVERGKSNHDVTNNYISIQNVNFSNIPAVMGTFQATVAASEAPYHTWTGAFSTEWDNSNNWSPMGIPTADDEVIIPNTNTTVNAPSLPVTATCKTLIIQSLGILNAVDGATLTLTGLGDAWNIDAGGAFNAGNSTIIFAAEAATAGDMSISGITNFYNVTVNSGSLLRPAGNSQMILTGTLTINGTMDALTNTNTIEFASSSAQTIPNTGGSTAVYHDLIISGAGTKTLPATLRIAGDFTNNGTIDALSNSSTVTIEDDGHDQTIGGSSTSTFHNLTINNVGKLVTAASGFNVNNILTVNTTLEMGSNSIGGTLVSTSGTGTLKTQSTSETSLPSGKTWTMPVIYKGTDAQSAPAGTYNNLTIDNSTGVTLGQATIGTLLLTGGSKLTTSGTSTATNVMLEYSVANGPATIVDNGTFTSTNSTAKQFLVGNRNWYLSSPVANVTTAGVAGQGYSFWSYDEPTAAWVTSDTGFGTGKGHILNKTAAGTLSLSGGTLNTGTKTVNLDRHIGIVKAGFNLVGNPYPSYLDWTSATKDKIMTTIWYRTKNLSGAYVFDTYNSGVGTNNNESGNVTGIIAPMQAFWVRVDSTGAGKGATVCSGSFTFNNSMRSHEPAANGNNNRLKAPATSQVAQQVLRMQVSNGVNSDEAIVLFNPNASNGYDAYDSPKMTNANVAIPEIYTKVGTENLVINGLNSIDTNPYIPLGFTTGAANTFTIRASEINNFDTNTQIILVDNVLNTEQNLTDGTAYSFKSEKTTTIDRFKIVFKTTGTVTEINTAENNETIFAVYKNNNGEIIIYIEGYVNKQASVSIYNAIGQKLTTKQCTGATTVLNTGLTPGVYYVSVSNEGSTMTKKIVFN